MKKDFLGNELNIGDEVIYMNPRYRKFKISKIVKLTDMKVKLSDSDTESKYFREYQLPEQLIKIKDGKISTK